jgi:hypothetical protein
MKVKQEWLKYVISEPSNSDLTAFYVDRIIEYEMAIREELIRLLQKYGNVIRSRKSL